MGGISPAVRSSLESHGLSVCSADFEQKTFRDEAGYRRELFKAVNASGAGMVFPVGDTTALSRCKALLPEGVLAAVEDEQKIGILGQKVPFSCLMSRMGIRQPYLYSSIDEAEGKDIIFKRNVSYGGHGVHRPRDRKALMNLIAHQPDGEPYLIEEYIEGEDYSVDAIRFGENFTASAYKVLDAKGNGPSTSRMVMHCPSLEDTAKSIMDELSFKGICGFDFKVDANGKAYILECNPRFTGGISTQIESGFDIPFLLWQGFTA